MMATMQIVGTCLQLLGAVLTALGLLHAWNRVTGKFDEWRNSVRAKRVELRAQIARRQAPQKVSFGVDVSPSVEMIGSVNLTGTGTFEERLRRAENDLATLPGQVDQAILAALDEKLAELDAIGKAFAAKDTAAAFVGICVTAVGVLLVLVDMLC